MFDCMCTPTEEVFYDLYGFQERKEKERVPVVFFSHYANKLRGALKRTYVYFLLCCLHHPSLYLSFQSFVST